MQFRILLFLTTLIPALVADDTGKLFEAIRAGDDSALTQMLAAGADPNSRNPQGATLLMQAALHSKVQTLQILLKAGSDPNLSNPMGATALIWAAGNPAKVRLLVDHGAQVNAAAKSGRTPLIVASAFAGNAETLRVLLGKGADPKTVDESGDGPLGSSATAADVEMIKILLKAGASVQERGYRGRVTRSLTPLMRAAAANCQACVEILLAAGSDPSAVSADAVVVQPSIGEASLGRLTPLMFAAQWGNRAIIKLLLDAGAKVDSRDWRGLNALMIAATSETQNRQVVELLLDKGSDATLHASNGETALGSANKWGENSPISLLLRERGVSPAKDHYAPPSLPKPATLVSPEAAVKRSLRLLQSSSQTFFEKSGCIACHHQSITALLTDAARRRGIPVDEDLARQQLKAAISVSQPVREPLYQRVAIGGAPMANATLLMGLHAQNYPADALTDAHVHEIAGNQRLDGSWVSMIMRPPVQYSQASETAYAVRALRLYCSPARKQEMDERILRAQTWLRSFEPITNEDRVMKALGLVWSGSTADTSRLLLQQAPDGSWAQRPGFVGDAYATGQAIYALRQAGFPAGHDAIRKGVTYLLRTQYPDGSWYVASRSLKFQPYFDSGFPFEHDQWISADATAWAALALLEAMP